MARLQNTQLELERLAIHVIDYIQEGAASVQIDPDIGVLSIHHPVEYSPPGNGRPSRVEFAVELDGSRYRLMLTRMNNARRNMRDLAQEAFDRNQHEREVRDARNPVRAAEDWEEAKKRYEEHGFETHATEFVEWSIHTDEDGNLIETEGPPD